MPSTYTPIATTTLGSAASSVTFSSISGAYTDLVMVFNGGTSVDGEDLKMQFNGDTSANYSAIYLRGNGTTAASGRLFSAAIDWEGNTTTITNNAIVSLQNYSNTTTYKSYLSRHNSPSSYGLTAVVGLWRSTAAISSIVISANSGNLISGSTFTLYGIKAA